MTTYEISGRAVVWHRKNRAADADLNLPTLEEILEAARREFPYRHLSELHLVPCGEHILLEEK